MAVALATVLAAAAAAQFSVDGIYKIPRGIRAYQISSYDRGGGNDDGNRRWAYLEFDRAERSFTIFDAAGPGRLLRFWMTGWRNPGELRFIGDGEEILSIPTTSLFSGDVPPFVPPLVGDELASSGGFYSYVPVDYDEELRIETASVSSYIQMQYYRYADAAARESEDARGELVDEADFPVRTATSSAARLEAGENVTVANLHGPALVERLTIVVSGQDPATVAEMETVFLDDLFLSITADGAEEPQFLSPLSEVAGGSLRGEPVDAIGSRVRASEDLIEIDFLLPIPFASELEVAVENRSRSRDISIETEAAFRLIPHIDDLLEDGSIGHLYAVHRRTEGFAIGQDVELVEWNGTGRLVGVVLIASSDDPENRRILEGDDRIYIDGAATPQIHGTGTEDFFNGGWYYKYGTFSLPTHGNPAHLVDPAGDHTSQYRYMPTDSIPFTHSIRMTMEHGPTNNLPGTFSSTVFLYGRPESSLVLLQHMDGEELLPIAGAPITSFDAPLIGTDDQTTVSRRGIVTEGEFGFVLNPDATARLDDGGGDLLLRRLTDYTLPNQSAEVYVNGSFAGVWLTPGFASGAGVVSTEFLVSGEFLKGEADVEVEIRPTTPWSAIDFEVFQISPSATSSSR